MTVTAHKGFDGYRGWSNRETWVINSWMDRRPRHCSKYSVFLSACRLNSFPLLMPLTLT